MYGLQSFDSWLYDDNAPFMHLEANAVFEKLRAKVDSGYFEQLIEKYLINNTHSSLVVFLPKQGLTAIKDAELAKKLAEYKASLSKEALEELVKATADLKKYQTEPSTKEELESIPVLKREDIKKNSTPFDNEILTLDNTKVVRHNFFTNGIGYLGLYFNCEKVSNELLPYLGLLKYMIGSVDTSNYSYLDLNNEIKINSGGVYPSFAIYSNVENTKDYKL